MRDGLLEWDSYYYILRVVGSCIERDFCLLNLLPSFFPSSLSFNLLALSFHLSTKREREREREMGNCQAIDAAVLVIQHPCGRIERLYWHILASEVMRMNPGHYVSLIIPLPVSEEENQDQNTVRFTRVKLLRPSDTLALGHAYRLITSQGTI